MTKKKPKKSDPKPPVEETPPPAETEKTKTSSTNKKVEIEEGAPIKLDPVEAIPPKKKAAAPAESEKAPEGSPDGDLTPPPGIAKIMLKSVFQTAGEFMEIMTSDCDMNFNEEEIQLLNEAWEPYLPDMPPWALATVATASVFSRKAMIFMKKRNDRIAEEKKAEAEKSGTAKPVKPTGEPVEPEPKEEGEVELAPAKV